jgi:hypothetical protein
MKLCDACDERPRLPASVPPVLPVVAALQPDQPDSEFMVMYETRSLRDTRELLKSTAMEDAYAFVDNNTHPRLWRILAEHALEGLDFVMADKAFVRCADYQVTSRYSRTMPASTDSVRLGCCTVLVVHHVWAILQQPHSMHSPLVGYPVCQAPAEAG